MTTRNVGIRRALGTAAGLGVALAATLIPASSAHADNGVETAISICAWGDYDADVRFQPSNTDSARARSGSCITSPIPAGTTWIAVYGHWHSNDGRFGVAEVPRTNSVVAYGSTSNGGADAYVWYAN